LSRWTLLPASIHLTITSSGEMIAVVDLTESVTLESTN
jgi:hypothetical protein